MSIIKTNKHTQTHKYTHTHTETHTYTWDTTLRISKEGDQQQKLID